MATLTEAAAEPALFDGSGSVVPEDAVAVFWMMVPSAVPAFTLTTSVNRALAPAARREFVLVMVPVPLEFQPAGAVNDTKVVFAGTASVKDRLTASLGPWLVSVIV